MTSVYYLNGKFAAQRGTGVQRVAAQLVQALDRRQDLLPGRWVLLCPPGAAPPPLQRIEVRHVGLAGWPLHLWEQVLLPLAARGGLLVSLSGSGPLLARRHAFMIHDAAIFDHPEAYTRAFVLWYRLLFRHMARHAERVFTVSQFSRGRLAARLALAPSRIEVIANGCDHLDDIEPDAGALARLGLQPGRYFLAVGSMNPTKNLDVLAAAFARLPTGAGQGLVIVGGRHDRVFAAPADAPSSDPPGVLRPGPLADADLKALSLHATALVFPSRCEGFGLPPLEAMRCGCPVIASTAAAVPEVCGDAPLYVDLGPGDPPPAERLARAMARLVADETLRARLSQAGLERANGFRWSAAAERFLAVLAAPGAPEAEV